MPVSNREDFIQLIKDVAQALGGEWTLKEFPDDWNWGGTLTEISTGAIIDLTSGGYRNPEKMHIRSELPKSDKGEAPYVGLQYGQAMPNINASTKKTGAQIARDIERRLMPEYLPLLEKAHEVIAQHNAFHSKTETMAAKIAKIARVPIEPGEAKVNFYHSPLPAFHENLGSAQVHADDVELNLRLDYDTALHILTLLAKS